MYITDDKYFSSIKDAEWYQLSNLIKYDDFMFDISCLSPSHRLNFTQVENIRCILADLQRRVLAKGAPPMPHAPDWLEDAQRTIGDAVADDTQVW